MRAEIESGRAESGIAIAGPPPLEQRRAIRRAVIFTGGLIFSVRKGIVELARTSPETDWLILEHRPQRSAWILLRNQWRNIRRNGWRWFPYQARDILARLAESWRHHRPRYGSTPGVQYDTSSFLRMPRIRYLRVADIHDEKVLDQVRDFGPDLGISLAAPILKDSLFEIPRLGTINLHKGKLPNYRGMPPAFWEFVNNEAEIGCTVHRVERGLDTGPILVQRSIERRRHSTVRGMQLALDELGVRLTCESLQSIADGSAVWSPQAPGGTTYRKPSLRQLASVGRGSGETGASRRLRSAAKDALYWGYVRLVRPAARRYLGWRNKQRVIILLYHRVSDELRDSLSVGIEQFDEQMEWLGRNCPLVSIADVVRGSVPRDSDRPLVAVTFDDGYLDNYENAVPILLRHKVPAAFFVSTGLIGGDNGFAHDLRRLGHALPTMNWEQLRHMHDLGFVIGSHTVTHLDCGSASLETVRGELTESRDALMRNLGLDEVIFAYPFGGRANITPAVIPIVKELGYIGCLSAYGGYIKGRIDPYNIVRTAINCNFSMPAFRARLEGFSDA